jgi:hypothetical protein
LLCLRARTGARHDALVVIGVSDGANVANDARPIAKILEWLARSIPAAGALSVNSAYDRRLLSFGAPSAFQTLGSPRSVTDIRIPKTAGGGP